MHEISIKSQSWIDPTNKTFQLASSPHLVSFFCTVTTFKTSKPNQASNYYFTLEWEQSYPKSPTLPARLTAATFLALMHKVTVFESENAQTTRLVPAASALAGIAVTTSANIWNKGPNIRENQLITSTNATNVRASPEATPPSGRKLKHASIICSLTSDSLDVQPLQLVLT